MLSSKALCIAATVGFLATMATAQPGGQCTDLHGFQPNMCSTDDGVQDRTIEDCRGSCRADSRCTGIQHSGSKCIRLRDAGCDYAKYKDAGSWRIQSRDCFDTAKFSFWTSRCTDLQNKRPDMCTWTNDGVQDGTIEDCRRSCLEDSHCTGIQHSGSYCDKLRDVGCDYAKYQDGGSWRIQSRDCFEQNWYELVHTDAGSQAVCNEAGRITAPCGNCGPDWAKLENCTRLCDQAPDCTHLTYFSDEGCRIYRTCSATWNQQYHHHGGGGNIQSLIYKKVSGIMTYEWKPGDEGTITWPKDDLPFHVVWDRTGIVSKFSRQTFGLHLVLITASYGNGADKVRALTFGPPLNDGGRRLSAARSDNDRDTDNDKIYNDHKGYDDAGLPILV